MTDDQIDKSEAARALSALGASKGGEARAKNLTKEQRQAIARQAADARWEREGAERLPRAIYGSPDRPLRIADREIPCFVLDDGKRVIAMTGMLRALDMSLGSASGSGGEDRLSRFAASKSLEAFVSAELLNRIRTPIRFRAPRRGSVVYGYQATILADLCDVVLAARKAKALRPQQEHIATQCEILVRAFARVGIIALVDEATGYQEDRAKDELMRILQAYISKALLPWTERFPSSFFREIYRLHGWEFKEGKTRGPRMIGHLVRKLVYEQLPPGVLGELERKNPVVYAGKSGRQRKFKHHQWLTEDIGDPHLRNQISQVLGIMRASRDKAEFMRLFERAFPASGHQLALAMSDE